MIWKQKDLFVKMIELEKGQDVFHMLINCFHFPIYIVL